ncbi:MAG: RnfABCDGE type electron transport complex subunit G [Clostridia bacterium]|nr:RnfABCDGE type electron transport complex subunit G [Clostridia bacterium]
MMQAKDILKPTIALFLICAVAAFLLALTNETTAQRIDEIAVQTENTARAALFPDAASFGDAKSVGGKTYVEALDETGNVIGYTFTTAAKGYGGDVQVMTGVSADGTVTAIEILDVSNETPGLGQNAKKDSFKAQFAGKSGTIGVSTASKAVPGGIDALTGATYTSRAVAAAVNEALDLFAQIPKGGNTVG